MSLMLSIKSVLTFSSLTCDLSDVSCMHAACTVSVVLSCLFLFADSVFQCLLSCSAYVSSV